MQQERVTELKPLRPEDLKTLAAITGPCVTMTIPAQPKEKGNKEIQLRMRQALKRAEDELRSRQVDELTIHSILEPIQPLAEDPEQIHTSGAGLLLMAAPEHLHVYALPEITDEAVVVGEHFNIKPLLSRLQNQREFYLLALTRNHVRLLHCTESESHEIPLPDSVPTNIDAFNQLDKPDHNLKNRHAAMMSGGTQAQGIMSGTGNENESPKELIYDFFRAIDKGLNHDVLRDSKLPLVPVAVEYELAIYRQANTYQNFVETGVHGSPDGLKGGEMHKRALELLTPNYGQALQTVLTQYEKLGGSEKTTHDLRAVVKAAYDGRVAHLMLAEGASHMGNFDEERRKVRPHDKPHAGDEDLLNVAAVQTLLHGGDVFVLSQQEMPSQAEVAAVLRY